MRIIAIYPGRFQPFGKHHAKAFEWLQNKFGKENTFIVTSGAIDTTKSPFSFDLKKQIIQKYGISPSQVIQVKDPYKAVELTSKFNPNTTATVYMYGEKDAGRLATVKKDGTSGYFQPYKDGKTLHSLNKHGYVITGPHVRLNVGGREMSGTSLRAALTKATPQTFKSIMGWYDFTLYNQIKLALSPLTKEGWVSFFNLVKAPSILSEGGAGGRMLHPFAIKQVKTGQDLLRVFELVVDSLQRAPASVKIDGINTAVKLLQGNGKRQFVMDRGSMKALDITGTSREELPSRFSNGMVKVGATVLDIFNDALPTIAPSLKKLGIWDDPKIMLNVEYVEGKTNIIDYGRNFLAIHGLLQIQQTSRKGRRIKEISHNKADLQQLLKGIAPSAKKYGYEVLGTVHTRFTKEPNFQKELQQKYTIDYGDGTKVTKTLGQWLRGAKLSNVKIKTTTGKNVTPITKEVLFNLLKETPLSEYILDPKDYQAAIDGYFIYLATVKLGEEILSSLDSGLGPGKDQEGIVIRDKSISTEPFKITGKFILASYKKAQK